MEYILLWHWGYFPCETKGLSFNATWRNTSYRPELQFAQKLLQADPGREPDIYR